MTTLFENPVPIMMVGGIASLLLLVAFIQIRKKGIAIAFGLVLLLTGGLLLLEKKIVTQREEVEMTLHAIALAIEQNDVEAVVAQISSTASDLRSEAAAMLSLATITEVIIKNNLTIEVEPDRNPPLAAAEFNVVIKGSDNGNMTGEMTYPRFMEVIFLLEEDGQWRVIRYEDENPVRSR